METKQNADTVRVVPLSDVDPLSPTYKGGMMTGNADTVRCRECGAPVPIAFFGAFYDLCDACLERHIDGSGLAEDSRG